MDNIYYVYEWIRLDTNEPFYVGKGKGNRWKKLTRNKNRYFNNIVKSIPVVVSILHDNLDEETANGLEVWYIREYRDVIGYDLCNIADGGEGCALAGKNHPMHGKNHSEESRNKISKNHADFKGENNPMYGKDWSEGKTEEEMNTIVNKRLNTLNNKTEEEKKEINKKRSEANKGKNNPMHGKNYRDYMTEEELREHDRKLSEANSGENNPQARPIICITTNKIFKTLKEGALYYNISYSGISQCCNRKTKSAGKLEDGTKLVWMYLEEYNRGENKNEYEKHTS